MVRNRISHAAGRAGLTFAAALLGMGMAAAVTQAQPPAAAPDPPVGITPISTDAPTLFPHTESGRYWISGQVNVIMQGHTAFHADYNGPNSLTPWAQWATTHVMTLYTGLQLTHNTEVFADMEDATGNGIGNANGLAGYVKMDSVRMV